MKPIINSTQFGSITINDKAFDHDVIICLNGEVKKRKKKLSKAVYGTSHVVSVDEAEYIHEKNAKLLIVGSGQYSALKLSEEAEQFFTNKNCLVKILSTPDAVNYWNKNSEPNTIGLFHLTC